MLFKRDLAIQTLPLSKRPFEVQPQLENEDVIEVLNMICPSSVGHTKIDHSMLTVISRWLLK